MLVASAHADAHILGAAHVGSMASGRIDRWSDIDLALCLAPAANPEEVVAEWTERLYRQHGAAAHLDVHRGQTLYRVFLLDNTLQVDLSFWTAAEFGASGPAFQLIFGVPNERPHHPVDARELVGLAWVHALHVRSSLARGRVWQAEYMLGQVRDHVLALACLRHALPTSEGRGWDDLPESVTSPLQAAFVRFLDVAELRRAFGVTMAALHTEIRLLAPALADQLAGPLTTLEEGGP